MGRRAARKGRTKKTQERDEMIINEEEREEEEREEENDENNGDHGGFFACYLLCSLSPRHEGHTYIGFTVNPRRRIRQHNGEIGSGAWRTRRGRPWEMILCIYGFPSNVSALQFEWAWQHPAESLAVKKAVSNFKSLSGIANKIKIAYTMLNLPSWENLNLTVNFFSTKHMKHLGGCPKLPTHMKVNICVMDELPCYVEGFNVGSNACDVDETLYDEKEKISEEHVSSSTKSDTSANSFERPSVCHNSSYKGSGNIGEEYHCFEDTCKSPSSCREASSFEWSGEHDVNELTPPPRSSNIEEISLSGVSRIQRFCNDDRFGYQSDLRCSDDGVEVTENFLPSPEGDIINLSTPSSCIVGKCNKRARVYSKIIDLTGSPIIIQL